MRMILIRTNITIDCEENDIQVREQVEIALNEACSNLEQNLTKANISYRIVSMDEI